MHRRELGEEEAAFLRRLVMQNMGKIDSLMQETARALAILTNYTTIVSEPKLTNPRMRHIQFVPIDAETVIMVLVTDNKVAKNHTIYVDHPMDYETLNKLSVAFNSLFSGRALQEMLDTAGQYAESIARSAGVPAETLALIWNSLANAILIEDNVAVYTSGAKNILGFPEFNDLEKARPIFEALEEKELLVTLLGGTASDDVSIVIGAENRLEELRNCSVIKANYAMGQRVFGSIGVIGPTRMDYPQVVSILRGIVKNINSVLKGMPRG
jgi:heat-inducible transcriptional repressor